MGFILGLVVGIVLTGVVAHLKPEWFNKTIEKAAKALD